MQTLDNARIRDEWFDGIQWRSKWCEEHLEELEAGYALVWSGDLDGTVAWHKENGCHDTHTVRSAYGYLFHEGKRNLALRIFVESNDWNRPLVSPGRVQGGRRDMMVASVAVWVAWVSYVLWGLR